MVLDSRRGWMVEPESEMITEIFRQPGVDCPLDAKHPIDLLHDGLEIVRDEQDGGLSFELPKDFDDGGRGGEIDIRRRLVEQKQPRL